MPKFTVTVELTSIEDLDKFHGAMRIAFGGPPTAMPERTRPDPKPTPAPTAAPETQKATAAPTPEPTAAPTEAPTPAPTAAPTSSPTPAGDGLVLTPDTPYEKTGLPAMVTKAVANDRAAVIALLAKFGVQRAGMVKPSDWPVLADGLKTILAAGLKS